MGNYVTVTPNSGRLQKVLTIGIPVEKFGVSVQSLMGVGRLKAVSYFSFESLYVESTRERGSGGGGVLPIMACTRKLHRRGHLFSASGI